MLLENRIAVVIGGGQTPGQTIGNGRATAIAFAREGATVCVADLDPASATETVSMIEAEGHTAHAIGMDVCSEASVQAGIDEAIERYGRIDILHNNVGVSIAAGDAPVEEIEMDNFDRLIDINLRGMVLTSKHALPHMRREKRGVIVNISSLAARKPYPLVGYKTTKSAVIALTEQLAITNARFGIRANVILPGLMNTPMAIEARVAQDMPREVVIAARDKQVPLGRRMGSAWDVANAAVFLASDKAAYVTGVALPVDGGLSLT